MNPQRASYRQGTREIPALTTALVFALLLVPGCTVRHPRGITAAPTPPNPDLMLKLTISPTPPRQLDPVAFTVTLSGRQGQPITGGTVTVSLAMPGMAMPPNEFTAVAKRPGEYAGTGRFTMPGAWVATVAAKALRPDKTTLETHRDFPVTVRP